MPSPLRSHAGYISRADIYRIDPRHITVRQGWNPRTIFDTESMAELQASIREHGVIDPLLVKQDGPDLVLIDGERRLRATLALIAEGVEILSVPALLGKSGNEADLLTAALIANQNEPLTPLDEARAYQRLIGYGWDIAMVAQKVGKSVSTVRNRLTLLEATPEVLTAVDAGEVTQADAVRIVKQAARAGQRQTDVLKKVSTERVNGTTQPRGSQTAKRGIVDEDSSLIFRGLCESHGLSWLVDQLLAVVPLGCDLIGFIRQRQTDMQNISSQ